MKVFLKCLLVNVHVLFVIFSSTAVAESVIPVEIFGLPESYKAAVLSNTPETIDGLSAELSIAYENNESFIAIDGIEYLMRITFVETNGALEAYLAPAQDDIDFWL